MFFVRLFPLGNFVRATQSKKRIRQCDWLKLAGEKIHREQVGSVPAFLCVCANKVAKWKIGLIQAVPLPQSSESTIQQLATNLYSQVQK